MKFNHQILTTPYPTLMTARILLSISFFFTLTIFTSAQQIVSSKEAKEKALYHLTELHKGTLVLVLTSDAKKRSALQEVIDNKKASVSQRKRAEKQLKKSIRGRKNFHDDLVSAFRQAYTFSDYVLIYDNDLVAFKEDMSRNYFLNENREQDNTIQIDQKQPIYYAREGYTDYSSSARVLSYIVYDSNNEKLEDPFPSVKISNLGPAMLIRSVLKKSDYREGIYIAERFDYMLKHRMAVLSKVDSESTVNPLVE